jgi:curli biogenesis system outer membrane secretion channel CsgG
MKFSTGTFLFIAAILMGSADAQAQFGKLTKTKTESGNADMKLGEYKGLKHAIGCKDFENQAGWSGQWDLGNNLSILLESALFDTGRFVMVEREKLGEVLLEQDLATAGRTAKSKTAAKTGELRSARYLATGAVTEVEDAQAGGAGGVRIKGFRIGGGKGQAHIAIIVKLVDTTTGEIVAKERVVGKAGGARLNVGLDVEGFSTEVGGFAKTPLGEAAQDCIVQASAFIAKKMESFPFEGSVVSVSKSGQVIINRGAQFGVEVGQILTMTEEGETLKDPETGEILEQEEGDVIGRLKVAKVSEKVSYCDVEEGEKKPATGTVVVAKE